MPDETKRTIQLLNEDLYGEHDAIVYYLTHAWTVARQYGSQILEIANDEMRHFKWLGHTISQLGGTPDLAVPPMTPASDLASALEKDVQAEIHAIDQYRQHADVIAEPRVSALLRRIAVDEQDHLRQFRDLLDQSQGQDVLAARPSEEVAPVAEQLQKTIHKEYQQMLSYLWHSFMEDHAHDLGLDMEERSIDEMRHMGWIGKRLGMMGVAPDLASEGARPSLTEGEVDEAKLYHEVRHWAEQQMPTLVPTLDRILAHEDYHLQTAPGQ